MHLNSAPKGSGFLETNTPLAAGIRNSERRKIDIR